MIEAPSPNFNARAADLPLCYVVLHYTGMTSGQEALARLCDPASEVSAHYMIEEDGRLYRLVAEDKRAWHAGRSFWRGSRDINSMSIGIELVNPGHEFGYRPFPDAQITRLCMLLEDLYQRHALKPESLLAHSDIAPTRREDPGELFPWERLATNGFGLWPTEESNSLGLLTQEEIGAALSAIGYEHPAGDKTACEAARLAFLRRYHPEQLEDGYNEASCARLLALSKLINLR